MTKGRISTLRRAWHRYLLHYPGQLLLSLAGIALGIAVVVSIDLAKRSALDAFIQATETISGKAAYRIVGKSGTIDEKLYPKLRLVNLPFRFSPKIEGYVKLDRINGDKLKILGIEPFGEGNFALLNALDRNSLSERERSNLIKLLTLPGYVIVSRSTAERFNLSDTGQLHIVSAGHPKILRIAARPEFTDPLEHQAMEDLVLTDIASAQEILELSGRITHIDVIPASQDLDSSGLRMLDEWLPDDVERIPYQRFHQNARELTASFYTNLTALSLLSVIVGMFLVYNTIHFLMIRRRPLIGMLRAIGASRKQIFRLAIGESAVLGFTGTLIGLLLGSILAHGMLDLIADTIDNVYFSLPTPKMQMSPITFVEGLLLGTLVSVLTAVPPALEATAVEPQHALTRSKLESDARRQTLKSTMWGISALVGGVLTTLTSGNSIAFGFAGLMLLVLGCALLTPWFLFKSSLWIYPFVQNVFGVFASLPVRSLNANLSRSGLAVAALMVAISAAVGVEIMVTSFRSSVSDWLEQRLSADIYISASTSQAMQDSPLNEDLRARIEKLDGVRSISSVRRRNLQHAKGIDRLSVIEPNPEVINGFDFVSGTADQIWNDFMTRETVIVTESYAYHHDVRVGSTLELITDYGPKEFLITGIYSDYNPGSGLISMSRSVYQRNWYDDGYSSLSVYAEPGTDLKNLQREMHALTKSRQVIEMAERSEILKTSIGVFDQAFAVTDILQWLAATIAFLGVFSVLTAIQLDRVREYGLLRAVGITSNQLALLITVESGLMGTIAGFLAIPVGVMTAVLLVFVINQRSFGWSIGFYIQSETIIQGVLTGIVAAILAGLIPALRMSRISPGDALRND